MCSCFASLDRPRTPGWVGIGTALAAVLAAGTSWAQPVSVERPTELDVRSWPGAAIGGHRLAPFFAAAGSRRVDVIGLGDSNHVYFGHGWEDGWSAALAARLGLYGTGLHSLGENRGSGSGIGYRCGVIPTVASGAFTYGGAGTPFDHLMNDAIVTGNSHYLHLPTGAQVPSNVDSGMGLDANSPVLASGAVQFQLAFGRTENAQSELRPIIRLNQPPYTVLTTAGPFNMEGPSDVAVETFGVANAPAGIAISCLLTRPGGPSYEAPMTGLYISAENPQQTVGAAYHVFYYRGGHSLWNMTQALNGIDPEQIQLFIELAVSRQNHPGGPLALVRINSGLNDLREANPSTESGIVPGSSPAAYADNLRSTIDRVRAVWLAAGFDDENLFFLLTPSHPIGGPDGQTLERYRDAAEAVALSIPRAACVRMDRLTDPSEMLGNEWYQAQGSDQYHLTAGAYQELALRELESLERWCPGDWTGDTSFDSVDIVQFLSDWERGEADANRDGGCDGDDIVLFFQLWDAAAC